MKYLSLLEYLEYSKRERKLRTDRQQINTQIQEIKDMSFTYKGQLSTDKDDRKLTPSLGHMLIIPFLCGLELEIIPAQTGNGTMKMYIAFKTSLSVDS